MTTINYYDLLQVSPKADLEIIQAAYRRLVLRWHPDRAVGNPDAEPMTKTLNAAYEVLSDPERRRQYDAEIASAIKQESQERHDRSTSHSATKRPPRRQSTGDILAKAKRQTQQMATFKITPADRRSRVLDADDRLCPFHGCVANRGAVRTALKLAADAFEAHVDIGLAAGKWHEPIWACSRQYPVRMLLTGAASIDKAAFARSYGAVVSTDWDNVTEGVDVADPRWKLPWVALDGRSLKKSAEIMTASERACRAKGLPLLPMRVVSGVRHYRVPPLCLFIDEVQAVPKGMIKRLVRMTDAQNGVLEIGVTEKIDVRPATIIVATSEPDALSHELLARFPTRFDLG